MTQLCAQAARDDGQTPLHEAAETGNARLAHAFLALGADKSARNKVTQSLAGIRSPLRAFCPLLQTAKTLTWMQHMRPGMHEHAAGPFLTLARVIRRYPAQVTAAGWPCLLQQAC